MSAVWIRTGTVAVTNGSAVVTGTGTAWASTVYAGDIFWGPQNTAYEVLSVDSNTQLTLASNYSGAGGAAGAASVMAAPVATETNLQGASTAYAAMAATYPQVTAQTMTFRSEFAGSVANFHWREGTVANGPSGAAVNMNRRLQEMGVKAFGAVWTLELAITLS